LSVDKKVTIELDRSYAENESVLFLLYKRHDFNLERLYGSKNYHKEVSMVTSKMGNFENNL